MALLKQSISTKYPFSVIESIYVHMYTLVLKLMWNIILRSSLKDHAYNSRPAEKSTVDLNRFDHLYSSRKQVRNKLIHVNKSKTS
jgi:hypothetical protein